MATLLGIRQTAFTPTSSAIASCMRTSAAQPALSMHAARVGLLQTPACGAALSRLCSVPVGQTGGAEHDAPAFPPSLPPLTRSPAMAVIAQAPAARRFPSSYQDGHPIAPLSRELLVIAKRG